MASKTALQRYIAVQLTSNGQTQRPSIYKLQLHHSLDGVWSDKRRCAARMSDRNEAETDRIYHQLVQRSASDSILIQQDYSLCQ